jgi:hypothetical protein
MGGRSPTMSGDPARSNGSNPAAGAEWEFPPMIYGSSRNRRTDACAFPHAV